MEQQWFGEFRVYKFSNSPIVVDPNTGEKPLDFLTIIIYYHIEGETRVNLGKVLGGNHEPATR